MNERKHTDKPRRDGKRNPAARARTIERKRARDLKASRANQRKGTA